MSKGVEVELERMKPCLHVTDKDLPQIKDWEVGQEYTIKVRQKSREVREGEDGTTVSAELELVGLPGETKKPAKQAETETEETETEEYE